MDAKPITNKARPRRSDDRKLWRKHTLKFGCERRRYYSNYMSGGTLSMSTQRSVTFQ